MATGSGSGQPVHFTSLLGSKDGHGVRLSDVRSGPRELMGIRVHLAVPGMPRVPRRDLPGAAPMIRPRR